jgi:hypothetical protein
MYRTWFLIVLVAVVGCGSRSHSSSVIDSPGKFPSPGGKYVLKVVVTPQSIVTYSVAQIDSSQQLFSGSAGSTYQRWFFFWDKQGNLWVYSSDIGSWVWKSSDGVFTEVPLADAVKSMQVPDEVKSALPESVKKHLGLEI